MHVYPIIEYKQNANSNNTKQPSFKEFEDVGYSNVVRRITPGITSGIDTFTAKALQNKRIKSVYEKFHKYYTSQGQDDIPKAFSSCINADGTLSKYALRTLNALYKVSYPELLENLKQKLFRKPVYGFKRIDELEGAKLSKTAAVISACKDAEQNINTENLKIAQQIFVNTPTAKEDIPLILTASKQQDGICNKDEIEYYVNLNRIFPQGFARLLKAMPDKDGKISSSVKNFINKLNGSTVVNSNRFEQADYILDVLEHTKNASDRDEILDFISESDVLKAKCSPVICYLDKDGNINLKYLKDYLDICEKRNDYDKFKVPATVYQSENDEITKANIEQILRFSKYYKNDAIQTFSESKFFRKDGVINKDFVDFIIQNEYMFSNPDSYNAYPLVDTAFELSAEAGNKKVNLEVAGILQNFGYNAMKYNNTAIQRFKEMMRQACELCKDSEGNFAESNIIETAKELKYIYEDLLRNDKSLKKSENYLREKYLAKITQDKNLYDTQTMLEILEVSGSDFNMLTTKIPDYDNLLLTIADIPSQNNPQAYRKIIDKLNCLENVNFNMKDSNGISLLEKVINSENTQLLKVISHPSNAALEYTPELDFAYRGIRDIKFKKQVDNELNLRFPQLEEAVKCSSKTAFEKIENQLDSPICKKEKVLENLWQIAKANSTKDFCNYFAKKYADDLPNSVANDVYKINTKKEY